eukprot:3321743-Pyramimonas_sp.AAC.1
MGTIPHCMLDACSSAFYNTFKDEPGGCVRSPRALAYLRLHARLLKLNAAPVEATHAAVRRRLESKGVQIHPEGLEELSAESTLDRTRRCGKPFVVQ